MKRFKNFLYNMDRALASLGGAPAQETLSSEIGRHAKSNWAARQLRCFLNWIDPNHTENAVIHANKLDAVDDGEEK